MVKHPFHLATKILRFPGSRDWFCQSPARHAPIGEVRRRETKPWDSEANISCGSGLWLKKINNNAVVPNKNIICCKIAILLKAHPFFEDNLFFHLSFWYEKVCNFLWKITATLPAVSPPLLHLHSSYQYNWSIDCTIRRCSLGRF